MVLSAVLDCERNTRCLISEVVVHSGNPFISWSGDASSGLLTQPWKKTTPQHELLPPFNRGE